MWKQLGRQIWKSRGVWTTAPTVAGMVIALRLTGWLQPLEWAALDQYFRWRPQEPADPRIVIVGINEADLRKVGQWPIPDQVLAQLIEKLKAQQPRAIGLDLYRDLPVQPGHEELVEVFETTPNLIGVEKKIGDDMGAAVDPPPVLAAKRQVGVNDIVVDADGKLRRSLLFLRAPDGSKPSSFGLRLALIYLKAEGIKPKNAASNPKYMQLGRGIFPRFQPDDGSYVRADAGGYQILLNYRGPGQTFRTVSMTEVLENRIPDNLMRNRIVLIGATAASLNDFFFTPYSTQNRERTPGVEVQANLASQILSTALEGRPLIQVWSNSLEWRWILLWSFIGALFSWVLRSRRWATTVLFLTGGGLIGGTYLAFLGGWWIPVVPPMLALIVSAIAVTGYIAQVEHEERQMMMNLFGRHVTPKIAEAIWRDRDQLLTAGRLIGRKMTATVVFTDLKGFSTVAEMMEPEVLMAWLNEYMEAMAQLVLEHGGVVDKFIGDAVMAVFGVPIPRTSRKAIAEDAVAAVSCAVAMAATLQSLNQKWQQQGRPIAQMRVGIATGTVVTGSLGSSQRLDYTTIGDSVNVAARLENYDKFLYGGICRILINEETYRYVQDKFPTKLIGGVQLKGREQQTDVYQVLIE